MEHPIPRQSLPAIVARATDPDLETQKKLAVARGVLPMSPENLLLCLYQLAYDPDEGVSRVARETIQGLPAEILKPAIAKLDMPEPIDFLAGLFSAQVDRMEAILLHRSIADETVERVARTCMKNVADLVAHNQERLLRRPAIIEALYLNKNTRMSTVDRIISFAIRHGLVLDGIPAYKELAAAIGTEIRKDAPEASVADRRRLDRAFDAISTVGGKERIEKEEGESIEWMEGGPRRGPLMDDAIFDEYDGTGLDLGWQILSEFDRDLIEAESGGRESESLSLNYQVSTLSVAQKIRLALLGTAAHRAILIADTNKLVAMSAIKSPTITDQEVLRYATSRSVSEEVVRFIAARREWTRNYLVKAGLVNNPKTPLPLAMGFLPHLRRNDLKGLVSNKNVPAALATAARNIIKRQETQK